MNITPIDDPAWLSPIVHEQVAGVEVAVNETARSRHYRNYDQDRSVVDRLSPGRRHLLLQRDVVDFIRILPDESARWFVEEHREVLDRLGVRIDRRSRQVCFVRWTEPSAKGFQLMHILLHELGHHHDRMTTRSRIESSGGESYAEDHAVARNPPHRQQAHRRIS